MANRTRLMTAFGAVAIATVLWRPLLLAQPKADRSAPAPADKLVLEEQRIADKYKHLEEVLLRMAELNAASDPRRAALLKKAVGQSKDKLIAVRFDQIVELLGKDQLSRALENQAEIDQDLHALLEMLISENRAKHILSEKARIRQYLKEINGIIRQEKDIQARTAGGDDSKRLAGEQGKVADKTGNLADDIRKNEERTAEGGRRKAESGNEGKKQDSQQQNQGQDQPQDPARKRLEAARQRMNDAEKQLKKAQRQGAGEKQEEAIRELQLAKAKLEAILRQLREEEIERTLAMLESRFRKMLQMQEEVYEGTVRLDKVPEAERTHNQEIEASRLSGKQSQIVVEMDKALLLLHDDGSAVAMLEVAQQIYDDMQQVVQRLAQAKVGKITQNIEEDIMTALKEAVEALKKAQQDAAKKKSPPGQQSPGEPQDPPLVDILAELKMIRALQVQVNTRTARYSKMIEGEQAENAELLKAIRRLAEREQRIHRVTRDLHMGKNQ
jgi:hypothetical protein